MDFKDFLDEVGDSDLWEHGDPSVFGTIARETGIFDDARNVPDLTEALLRVVVVATAGRAYKPDCEQPKLPISIGSHVSIHDAFWGHILPFTDPQTHPCLLYTSPSPRD